MTQIDNSFQIFLFVSFVFVASSQSTDWHISSHIVLNDTVTSVQRHPNISDIAYGSRMHSGLDTLRVKNDIVELIRTEEPTNPAFAYYRLHVSPFNHDLYVAANSGGVIRFDITTNASHPIWYVSHLHRASSTPAIINAVTTDANYVYAVGHQSGTPFIAVLSHNLKTMHGQFQETGEYFHMKPFVSVHVVWDSVIIATGDTSGRLWTFDVTNPANISVTGELDVAGSNGAIYGITSPYYYSGIDTLLAAHTVYGIISVDLWRNSPYPFTVEIGNDTLGGSKGADPWWIERVGSIGYVANGAYGISIVNVSSFDSFSVIDFINDGPNGTPLIASGLAVFHNNILVPNTGDESAAGYVLFTNRTASPTKGPTSSPITIAPTQAPTDVTTPSPITGRPTIAPTQAPTDVTTPSPITSRPTIAPTQVPTTGGPTIAPSVAPTDVSTPSPVTAAPTQAPMDMRTSSPNVNYSTTVIQSVSVTYDYLITTSFDFGAEQTQKHLDNLEELSELFRLTAGAFVAACALIGLSSWIDAKVIRPNDYFHAAAILSMLIQTVDIMSDCFFVMEVEIQASNPQFDNPKIQWIHAIMYASVVCIAVPALTSLFQLFFYAKRHWLGSDYVRSWLAKYSTILLLLSIVTGSSFAAISLLNSFIFQFEMFDMGLTDKEIKQFNTQRVYSIVIMENVPQLFIQSYYIYLTGALGDNLIAMSSIMFSLISIIVSVMSLTLIKTINKTQRYVVLSMDVTGDCVEERSSKCRTMKNKLKKRICALIGVDGRMLDIMKPTYIANGLRVQIRVYVNDKSQSNNYVTVMIQANESGKLPQMFETYWNLSDVPKICDIESDIVDPTQEMTHKTGEQKETLKEKAINIDT